MELKPIWEWVNCEPLGYADVDVQVRVNPSGGQGEGYRKAANTLIVAITAAQDATKALADNTDGDAAGALQAALDTANEAIAAAEADYEERILSLVRAVRQRRDVPEDAPADERYDVTALDSRKALNDLARDADYHIVRFGLQVLWDINARRATVARDSFRERMR